MYDIIVAGKNQNSHLFEDISNEHPHAIWMQESDSIWQTMRNAKKLALTEMFWLVTDDMLDVDQTDVDFAWKPPVFDRAYPHVCYATEKDGTRIDRFSGLHLMPRGYEVTDQEVIENSLGKVKVMENFNIRIKPFDVFFAGFDDMHSDANFERLSEKLPDMVKLGNVTDIWHAMREANRLARTSMFWLVTDELLDAERLDVDFDWKPPTFDRIYPHVWPAMEKDNTRIDRFSGLHLMPRGYEVTDQEVRENSLSSVKTPGNFGILLKSFDMFFISYDEKYANRHFNLLKRRFPEIKRVHGIEGIANAHRRCAELSDTNMFWTIDADTVVDAEFDFSYKPVDYDRKYLHIWNSRNPVNGLEYGWGAVKLWPRNLVMSHDGNYLDYTTSLGFLKIVDDVVATTCFNSDPFRAWRSGFREAVKLARNVSNGDRGESLDRLTAWCTIANRVPFASDAVIGANDGLWYYLYSDGPIDLINDFGWLRSLYLDKSVRLARDWDHEDLDAAQIMDMVIGCIDA